MRLRASLAHCRERSCAPVPCARAACDERMVKMQSWSDCLDQLRSCPKNLRGRFRGRLTPRFLENAAQAGDTFWITATRTEVVGALFDWTMPMNLLIRNHRQSTVRLPAHRLEQGGRLLDGSGPGCGAEGSARLRPVPRIVDLGLASHDCCGAILSDADRNYR